LNKTGEPRRIRTNKAIVINIGERSTIPIDAEKISMNLFIFLLPISSLETLA
jgi:hypothetical protein